MVVAAVLLLAGGALTLLAALQNSSGGYFSTPTQRFTTSTAALKSDEIDVSSESARAADPNADVGDLARVRVIVRAADPQTRLFVGIGPKQEVEAFLDGTSYDEFTSAELTPFRADFDRLPGRARAESPTAQPFWVASSTGSGPRTVEWNKTPGTWSLVVMRLDGEPGLDVSASIGLRFGFLFPAGIGTLISGSLLLAYALITRQRPTTRSTDTSTAFEVSLNSKRPDSAHGL